MNGTSLNIQEDNVEKLKTLFPDVFSEGKIDMEKFNATFSDNINFSNERYVLNWAGKGDAFKVLQIPTTATLNPHPEESVNFDTTQNIFIEGENLEVLKILQKSYYNQIKCIIIDPPYNTGSDSFIYPDSFKENKADYEKRIGDKDEEGYLMKEGMFRKNSKDSGHYHSNWLSMMYPRLFLAKNLLREDGVIFVHIDDNEVHNLRLLMNEILGEENFVASIIWQKKYSPQNDATYFSNMHDYIICFAKNKKQSKFEIGGFELNLLDRTDQQNARYSNPDNDSRGDWKPGDVLVKTYNEKYVYEITTPSGRIVAPPKGRCWRYSKEKFTELIRDNRIWFGVDGSASPSIKRFLSEVKQGVVPSTLWLRQEAGDNQEAANELKGLMGGLFFETPKPVRLIRKILELSTKPAEQDIVLDFFAGSGTTSQAVLELNQEDHGKRKFILVQLPELVDINSESYKEGYKSIADIGKERIRRSIKKIEKEKLEDQSEKRFQIDFNKNEEQKPLDLGFKCFKLTSSNFKVWRGTEIAEDNLVQQLDAFTNPVRKDALQENMLFELILKAGYLLTDKIDKKVEFYSIKEGELLIGIETMNQSIVNTMISLKPKKVITLDILFKNNDQLKTNTVLQMKDAGIDFKTI
jgi:adenine-specific DNA-methyltransferase